MNQSLLLVGVATAALAVACGEPTSVGGQQPTKLAFSVQPTNAVAGDSISPAIEVEIRDASDKVVATASDPVTLAFGTNAGNGTLSGTLTVDATDGIANFTGLWIDKAATGYTLAATSGSLTGATSSAFNVNPGAPVQLAFATQPTDAQGNVVIAPAVSVAITDSFDNQTTTTGTVTVALENNPWAGLLSGGGSLSGTLTAAASNGVATFSDLRVDDPGAGYTLAATSGALTAATSAAFSIKLAVHEISAGEYHTCAVTAAGAYCWGADFAGQLGYPVDSAGNNPIPGLVGGGMPFVQVSGGNVHSCGLTAQRAAYCWGGNSTGQLGNGDNVEHDQPVAVSGSHVFASISAGAGSTCGVTTASGSAAEDRQVYCWGYNGSGELGNNSTTSSNVPVRVAEPLQTTAHAIAVSVARGGDHVCARTAAAFYCWGDNALGQLGNGTTTSSSVPVQVSNITAFMGSSIATGAVHSCAVDATSHVVCWGANGYGQLGNNTTTDSDVPVSTGSATYASVTAAFYASCAVGTDGIGWCWGDNMDGELGDGGVSGQSSEVPVRVSTTLTFDAITGGGYHACGRAGTTVYCWGANHNGQLGSGSTSNAVGTPPQPIIQ